MPPSARTKIAVTGADGLFGWHLRVRLSLEEDCEVAAINRKTLGDDGLLREALEGASAVVHLAAMNRGDEDEVHATNVALARRLGEFLRSQGRPVHVLHSSSTHIETKPDSKYARSKREAADLLEAACAETKGNFSNVVFPHLFGENGRPFYNSVVSTFCHQLVSGETPEITGDGDLELLHCQDAADFLFRVLESPQEENSLRARGAPLKVSELKARLESFWRTYEGGIFPELITPLDIRLFNTLRSYCSPDQHSRSLPLHSDPRGTLVEFVKEKTGGQVFFSTTEPGAVRGNHFHRHKIERLLVVGGEAEIRMRRTGTEESRSFSVRGEEPCYVDIPTLWTHHLVNTGSGEMMCLFFVNETFNPSGPDTYFEEV